MKIKSLFLGLVGGISAWVLLSCNKETVKHDTLSVEPSASMSFEASANKAVTLKVTATKDWKFTVPNWVKAKKDAKKNTLEIKVDDNTSSEARVGRIVFKAGKALPVKINIFQSGFSDNGSSSDGVVVKLVNKSGESNIFAKAGEAKTLSLVAAIDEKANKDVEVELLLDAEYVGEYNFMNEQSFELFPKEQVTLPEKLKLTIPAGKTESEPAEILLNCKGLSFGTQYLVPVFIKGIKNATVKQTVSRLNYVVTMKQDRAIKNVLYFEVNDVNPLNALEYVLEDGTPFFDAVILFAANINYNSVDDVVYLHNNPNVSALLKDSEIFLQPLRKAGIKVYLGLLGNHDCSGLAQLSDWGAHEWAQEVADACKKYKLDGVNLDDEYSSGPIDNKWFAKGRSAGAAGRLMYELKMAMKEKCPWPTEVSYFEWGAIYNVPPVVINNVTHPQSEFIDFYVANYGSATAPYGDLTMKNCSGASIEINRGYMPYGNWAETLKANGYGWCMWFAFDPSGTGSVPKNLGKVFPAFRQAAKAFYGQDIKYPTGAYTKLAQGKYDPKRHNL